MASLAHCIFCFEVLAAKLESRKPLPLAEVERLWALYQAENDSSKETRPSAAPMDEHPIFVTWNIESTSGRERLRGCKGTFSAEPLEGQLSAFALISALEDIRFRPIASSELDQLSCGVTILHSFQPIDDPISWTVGKHGIRLAFRDQEGKMYRATYLPDVPSEQGWTQHDALQSAARKAGWHGDLDGVRELKVITYEGWKEKASYHDFQKWRLWLQARSDR